MTVDFCFVLFGLLVYWIDLIDLPFQGRLVVADRETRSVDSIWLSDVFLFFVFSFVIESIHGRRIRVDFRASISNGFAKKKKRTKIKCRDVSLSVSRISFFFIFFVGGGEVLFLLLVFFFGCVLGSGTKTHSVSG